MTRARPTRKALRALPLLLALACGSDDVALDFDGSSPLVPSSDYQLGGQTGSLVPDCGLAPLSAGGSNVPTGEALAILYAKDCPEGPDAVALDGSGRSVALALVPLAGTDVYLVRAERLLSGGDYQLSAGSDTSLVSVDAELRPPGIVGALTRLPASTACEDPIRFQLSEPRTLAYAPLARFWVSVDGSEEQLWIDYGALPLTVSAEGSSAVLELPRCGLSSCIDGGQHSLDLRMEIAGAANADQPFVNGVSFQMDCPLSDASALSSSDTGTTGGAGASCALLPGAGDATRAGALLAALALFGLRRRRGLR